MISATLGRATVSPPGGCTPGTRLIPAWSGGPVSSLCLKSVAEKCDASAVHGCWVCAEAALGHTTASPPTCS